MPLRLGIAGRGFMGTTHRRAVALLPGIELAAAHDYREILASPAIDAIDICLPTDLHASVAIEAFAAGKHVFCEKPMALTPADCCRMIEVAHTHKRVLMIGHVLRFWPGYLTLRQFVADRRDTIRSVLFTRRSAVPAWGQWLQAEQRSGGAILDLMIHDIDQCLLLFGKPKWVSAKSPGPVDTMDALLEYSDSLTVRIQGGWYPEGTEFHMSFTASAAQEELAITPSGGDSAYSAELAYFAECAAGNARPHRCPPEAAADAVALALLLKRAREQDGKRIECVF